MLSEDQVVIVASMPNPSYGWIINPGYAIVTSKGIVEYGPIDLVGSDRWVRHLEIILHTCEKFRTAKKIYTRPSRIVHSIFNTPWLTYKRDPVVSQLVIDINKEIDKKQHTFEVALPGLPEHKAYVETVAWLTEMFGRIKINDKQLSSISDN